MKINKMSCELGVINTKRELLQKINELLLTPSYIHKYYTEGYKDALTDIKDFLEGKE